MTKNRLNRVLALFGALALDLGCGPNIDNKSDGGDDNTSSFCSSDPSKKVDDPSCAPELKHFAVVGQPTETSVTLTVEADRPFDQVEITYWRNENNRHKRVFTSAASYTLDNLMAGLKPSEYNAEAVVFKGNTQSNRLTLTFKLAAVPNLCQAFTVPKATKCNRDYDVTCAWLLTVDVSPPAADKCRLYCLIGEESTGFACDMAPEMSGATSFSCLSTINWAGTVTCTE